MLVVVRTREKALALHLEDDLIVQKKLLESLAIAFCDDSIEAVNGMGIGAICEDHGRSAGTTPRCHAAQELPSACHSTTAAIS
jgi:hypothetical protein